MPRLRGVSATVAVVGALLIGTGSSTAGVGTASGRLEPALGHSVLIAPVRGVVLIRFHGRRRFSEIHAAVELPVGSEIDTTRGTASVTEATHAAGGDHIADVFGGRAIVTQRDVRDAPATFRLSQPLDCSSGTFAQAAGAGSSKRRRPRRRHITVHDSGGPWNTNGHYVATGAESTEWTTTDTCGASTVAVEQGAVRVTNLVTHTTVTLHAGQHLTVHAITSADYTCVGTETELFNNWNTNGVLNGGKPPAFSTRGKAYCLKKIATYHYNDGHGSRPGKVELTSSLGTIGPLKAIGQAANGGPGDIDWIATPPASSTPVIIDGTYTCRDSDPATWAEDPASNGKGFCRVYVTPAVKG